ncbi:MAG: SAM-dependent methyltransferase [Sciscionella sp.]|nr:SAM-dependent methyltransferase [Sciscionella sp.]
MDLGAADHGPRVFDESTPNSARLYDYFLGGAHNFAADRALGERIKQLAPIAPEGARLNRSFLRRVVRFMAEQGITQFLDLGSGIPTVGNVHEIAQSIDPNARVVYVDYEPVAYQTAKQLVADNPNVEVLHEDFRDVDAVLEHPRTRRLLDLSRPVGLLMISVLLFVPDADQPARLIARYRDALAAGSFLGINQISVDEAPPDVREQVDLIVAGYQNSNERWHVRTRAEIESWFAGTELVEPGLVRLSDWRPDDPAQQHWPSRFLGYGGVGHIVRHR